MTSSNSICLEICVDSIQSAINAAAGGADRLELCSALSEGGLSPTPALLRVVKKNVDVPVFCMIRPRSGPMVYKGHEKDVILEEARDLIAAGTDGLVFGALTSNGNIDEELCREFLTVAGCVPCTFHRAFDLSINPLKQLEIIISLGFTRLLTSGCKSSAIEGASFIKKLVGQGNGRIIIMAGAGVRADNCVCLVLDTGVEEIHSSAKEKIVFATTTEGARMGTSDDNFIYVSSTKDVSLIKSNVAQLKKDS